MTRVHRTNRKMPEPIEVLLSDGTKLRVSLVIGLVQIRHITKADPVVGKSVYAEPILDSWNEVRDIWAYIKLTEYYHLLPGRYEEIAEEQVQQYTEALRTYTT